MSTTPTDQLPQLPEKPKSNGKFVALGAGALVALLAAGVAFKSCSDSSTGANGQKLTKITVGTTEASDPYWTELVKVGREKYGLDITPKNFTDYTQANPALAQGQIDLNQFQHLQFLADYNVSDNQQLRPVGSTYIVPLALYSKKHQKLNEISSGKIAIPNDPTNQARALLLLQSAGLLKLKGGGNSLSTPADIDAGNSKVTVAPMDAAQTAAALDSVEASVVNNNFAADAKLNPQQALFKDDPKAKTSEPYINVIVARKADVNKPEYKKLVSAYHDPAVQKRIQERTKGTSFEVKKSPSDVTAILTRLEDAIKAKK